MFRDVNDEAICTPSRNHRRLWKRNSSTSASDGQFRIDKRSSISTREWLVEPEPVSWSSQRENFLDKAVEKDS